MWSAWLACVPPFPERPEAASTADSGSPTGTRVVAVGRLGRVLLSDDLGQTFFSDVQEGDSPDQDEFREGSWLQQVVAGAGGFVAAGGTEGPLLRWSADGVDWEDVMPAISIGPVFGLARGDGQFVAVEGATLLRSVDGRSWDVRAGTFWTVRSLAFGGGRFVAVGDGRRAVTLDGESWLADQVLPGVLWDVAYGEGRFVAVGDDGLVATSADGVSWDDQTVGTANRFQVAYGAGRFVSAGYPDKVLVSEDGLTFELVEGNTSMGPIGHAGGAFFADVYPNGLVRSDDGLTWFETVPARADRAGITSVAGP